MNQPVRRALISVSDKNGLVEFASALAKFEVHILSTGGTARLLAELGHIVEEAAPGIDFGMLSGAFMAVFLSGFLNLF